MEYMTTTEISSAWGISARRVAVLCKQNRIEGVIMKGKTWLIPSSAIKPDDYRRKDTVK
ncbi:MerR family transcriptional regulator [[Clostridium] fimetarium]|uniref:DNA adenine methylase n=1 Tax=[Clostridium] fimetarium TaxID=99656 RepID=A0A1I0QVB7_9FIRM|nr:helix-turn-helix domain-containing protein [[Clostridium] fimetarium]SEW31512.1 DNA adenine methylase [[Clostridium] fimetarium]